MLDPSIGIRIRILRESKHFSRETLAEEIGISARFIASIEANERGLSLDTFVKLANCFDVTLDYLYYGQHTISVDTTTYERYHLMHKHFYNDEIPDEVRQIAEKTAFSYDPTTKNSSSNLL